MKLLSSSIHASMIAYQENGVLLLGPSGRGKSDLCLRLIHKGGQLVADDCVELYLEERQVKGRAPQAIQGALEIRGVGLINYPYHENFPVHFAIKLTKDFDYERLPEDQFFFFENIQLPLFHLCAFEASVLEKIDIIINQLLRDKKFILIG